MAVPSPSSKTELRSQALERRRVYARSLAPDTRAALDEQLALLAFPRLAAAQAVAAYFPMVDEISPLPLAELLAASGQAAAFPWFAGRDSLMVWREGPAVEPGPWGVLQPAAGAPAVSPDVVLVPFVLADRSGTRIGRGKGHYDRALSHLKESRPVRAIGIGWDLQVSDEPLPADPWDARLDAIITPTEWIDCR